VVLPWHNFAKKEKFDFKEKFSRLKIFRQHFFKNKVRYNFLKHSFIDIFGFSLCVLRGNYALVVSL